MSQSNGGQTTAIVLVGIISGLFILAFGIRAFYQITRFWGNKGVEKQECSVILDVEKAPQNHTNTSINHRWSILPGLLVKLGRVILRGGNVSAISVSTHSLGHVHSNAESQIEQGQLNLSSQDTLQNDVESQPQSENTPCAGQDVSSDDRLSVGSEFKFPQILTVPRRPSALPPDAVLKVLEQAESWWFESPAIIQPRVIVLGYEEQNNKGDSATTKDTRRHQRCRPLLGPQKSSTPSPIVFITPPTPPKLLLGSQALDCPNTPGLHPILGSINSLEAQGRQHPTLPSYTVHNSSSDLTNVTSY